MLRQKLTKVAWAGALLGVMSFTGCYGTFHEVVDPCYPERYNCKARESVHEALQMQVQNGLAYEQTLYVHHFNPSESTLNAGGVAHLTRLANRRPAAVTTIFLQTAQNSYDLDYKKPEEYASKRRELDEKRKAEVENFLKNERPDLTFTVYISNPAKLGMSGAEGSASINDVRSSSRGYFMIPGFAGGSQ
ncbi:MAG TPA: hypothetical protein PKA06_02010 [Gemmatales bacterium]|nr:hypothetical protein [Gemmatales bacterium]HMP15899.1 hypothetical protein [Gemmatales bacterium]